MFQNINNKMLGLDISSRQTGWAFLKDKKMTFGYIKTPTKLKGLEAILFQEKELLKIIDKLKPKSIVIEDTYLNHNFSTVKLLNELRVFIYIWGILHNYNMLKPISASRARSLVGIKSPKRITRKQRKQIVINFMQHMDYNVENDDEADAICLILAVKILEEKNERNH